MSEPEPMGLAPGGRMRQEVYKDPYDFDEWDFRHFSRCFVTIANSVTWRQITGEMPPTRPQSALEYTVAGLPWFDYYGDDLPALRGADNLAKAKSVAEVSKANCDGRLPDNESVIVQNIVRLGNTRPDSWVREF